MKKSVYSLVLSDGVVAEIDRLAYETHTNRSQLVNRILAEYVSYITPEKRFQDIFQRIDALLSGRSMIQRLPQPSDTVIALRSALLYKYNPTLKYTIELYKGDKEFLGEMRVGLRTQSDTLLKELDRFYGAFTEIEHSLTGHRESCFEGGRFFRKLRLRSNPGVTDRTMSSNTLGDVIAAYVRLFDDAVRIWFSLIGEERSAIGEIEALYRRYLSKAEELI